MAYTCKVSIEVEGQQPPMDSRQGMMLSACQKLAAYINDVQARMEDKGPEIGGVVGMEVRAKVLLAELEGTMTFVREFATEEGYK